MGNLQVRLPDRLEAELDRLAQELHGTRSDAIRHALVEGLRAHREEAAVQAFVAGRSSLGRAAADAGMGLAELARRLQALGVPALRYTRDEADQDLRDLGG